MVMVTAPNRVDLWYDWLRTNLNWFDWDVDVDLNLIKFENEADAVAFKLIFGHLL